MDNQLEVPREEDSGVLKFDVDMTVDDFLDQYIIWRLNDILRYEDDAKVVDATKELLAYFTVQPSNVEDDGLLALSPEQIAEYTRMQNE